MDLFSNTYFALFLIIALGYLLGRIKIAGISLDVSAVLFVAIIFGHFQIINPAELKVIQRIGLVLFIYSIGLQAGPGFFSTFKKQGRNFAILGAVLVASAALVTYLSSYFFEIKTEISIGLLTGALTSTPGLAAAIESTQSPLASIGYGIAYPFGVIGVILFVKLMPKLLNKKVKDAENEYEKESLSAFPMIDKKNFLVENQNVNGKTIGELRIRHMTKGVVSRVMRNGEAFVPTADTKLYIGDILKVVAPADAFEKVNLLIGSETEKEIPLATKYDVQSILVSNKEVANMTVKELNLLQSYNATITRIRRSGIDITPNPNTRIQLGDKMMIACAKDNMKQVVTLLGNDDKRLSDSDLLPVALGIVLGVLIGQLKISFTSNFEFSLGLTGGVLLISLLLSNMGKTGKIVWNISGAANQLLRQLGLLFFLSAVGSKAGAELASTFAEYGIKLFAIGAVITLVPMLVTVAVARFGFKINLLSLMGAITGGMTSTPGLAATTSMSDSDAPQIAYATIYPVAMVILIIFVQILSHF
ncbi:aspartate:alanine exchanger family transporter [Saccharicrinis sp. FJH54]|uniref:aspartate:alanine exchanger family transporter n=1 Tax=Saccharicrinis sp. FJH54 TaxID=3344665 RepID=UPI0035D4CBD9